jgi:TolB-like protein/DNA-binding winged helix-turn-helix (wHTH) protein/Tfp pilus assembly protein PilF
MNEQEKILYEFGPFRLETVEQRLTREGVPIPLARKTYEVLLILVRNSGSIVDKNRLLQEIWPDTFVEEGSLTVNVSILRKALGEEKEGPKYIETVPRVGYRFVGEVKVTDEKTVAPTKDAERTQETDRDAIVKSETAQIHLSHGGHSREAADLATDGAVLGGAHSKLISRLRKRPYAVTLFCIAVIVIGIATLIYLRRPARELNSIAVVPLANESPDENTEYLSDGITENIINKLSQLPKLKVISRATMFRYKGSALDPLRVGHELNVSAVLTGRIMKQGDDVSIEVELLDVASGRQLWKERFNRKFADLISTQTDVANRISESLMPKLTAEERSKLSKNYSDNSEAYLLYLRGRYLWNQRTVEGVERGIEYFNQALIKDPNYAPAYAGLADSYNLLPMMSRLSPHEAMPKGREAALKALEIDETFAEAHTSLAFNKLFYDFDREGAEKEFNRAIELQPNYAPAHQWFSLLLAYTGRDERALIEIGRAQELDPLSIPVNSNMGIIYFFSHHYDNAKRQFQQTLELAPVNPTLHWWLASVDAASGNYIEALAEFKEADPLANQNESEIVKTSEADSEAKSRYKDYWQHKLAFALKTSKDSYISPAYIAQCYVRLEDNDQALSWLEKAYDERDSLLLDINVNPIYEKLQVEPRFKHLLQLMSLSGQ